jgi:RNA polymerase sigma factor (sigma-70 family)
MAERDDGQLLRAAGEGKSAAFGLFYDRYVDAVLAYFGARVRDAEAAADLAAETFAVALRAAPRYRPDRPTAAAWLFTIAHHLLVDARRRGRVADRARRRLAMQPLVLVDDDLERVDRLVDLARSRGSVLALVAGLPEDQRAAIHARVVEERDYAEVAAALQCSESVVRQRVSRGLRTLRAGLEERRS